MKTPSCVAPRGSLGASHLSCQAETVEPFVSRDQWVATVSKQ
jgi:hypothetical protein